MNEKIFTSTKLVTPTYGNSWYGFCYMQVLDAFILNGQGDISRVFRDGTKIKFGQPSGDYSMTVGRVKGQPAFYSWWNGGKIYSAFEINGLPNPNEVLNPNCMADLTFGGARYIDDMNGLLLEQSTYNQIRIRSLTDKSIVATIIHNQNCQWNTLAWAKYGHIVGMNADSGKVALMDYLSSQPQVIATGQVDPFQIGAYDCSFKLFVTIGTDYKVRIYTGDLIPNGLSDPVFSPVTITGYNANEVTVRLTGSGGEPMPNYWVNWILEGVGGEVIGRLDKFASITDLDGYAKTLYLGPDDDSNGQCKVKALVVL
jgi:hypothetical protein